MNSSLEKLVANLTDNDFKYLTKEFGFKNLELLKPKDDYPCEYMDSFKRFGEEKLPDRECFYSSVKDGTTDDNGEKLDGHISHEGYLTCRKIGINLTWKIWEEFLTLLRDILNQITNTWKIMTLKNRQILTYLDMNNFYDWAMKLILNILMNYMYDYTMIIH